MAQRFLLPCLALAPAALAAYVGWRLFGVPGLATAVVVTSPVVAIAFARPVLSLLAGSVRLSKAVAYADVEGRHFEYKGHAMDVREDLTGARWLRVSDVRKIIRDLPQTGTLQNTMPDGLGYLESPRVLRISAMALAAYLAKSTSPPSIRFRVWLLREVIYPSGQNPRRFKGTVIDDLR